MDGRTVLRAKLGEILVSAGAIDPSQLTAALAEQRETGRPLGMTLVRMGYLDEETLVRTLSQQLQLPMTRLAGKQVPADVLELVPLQLADKHRCLPLLVRGEGAERTLLIAIEDPSREGALEELTAHVGMSLQPVLVGPTDMEEALHRHHDQTSTAAIDPDPLGMSAGDLSFGDSLPGFASTMPSPLDAAPASTLEATLETPLDFDDDTLGDASELLAFETEPAPPPPGPAAEAVSQVAILRALTQLLIEKGVFTREELIERVHAFASQADPDG